MRLGFATRAVHGSQRAWPTSPLTSAVTPPIFQTATFSFQSLDDAVTVLRRGGSTFAEHEDYVYTRGGNPTQRELEHTLASLEGAADAVVFSSGMAAISAVAHALLAQGAHVLVTDTCFGDTHQVFAVELGRFGIQASFVDTSDIEAVRAAIRPSTRMLFIETPANPTLKITDLEAVTDIARRAGITTVVDSTFACPKLQRPLAEGADAVVHSVSKYINGHGDAIGGVVATSDPVLLSALRMQVFTAGAVLDPMAAFLILRGIQTLPLRMEQHCSAALFVAHHLARHPGVERVFYPGLESHPQHALAARQMRGRGGGVVAFELAGGAPAARRFLGALRLVRLAVSLGSTRTLAEYPAAMTHGILSPEARAKAGISDGLVRLSVGLEDVDDIVSDLDQGLR